MERPAARQAISSWVSRRPRGFELVEVESLVELTRVESCEENLMAPPPVADILNFEQLWAWF